MQNSAVENLINLTISFHAKKRQAYCNHTKEINLALKFYFQRLNNNAFTAANSFKSNL